MQRRILISILVTAIWLSGSPVYAGGGSKGGQVLNIQPGARPVAMGGAFAGLADDVNAIYWNPAGLGFITTPQAVALYNSWFEGIKYEYLGYVRPGQKLNGSLGLGLTLLQIDDIQRRTENTEIPLNTFGAKDISLAVGWGLSLNNYFCLGANLKYLHSRIDTHKGSGVALDAGVLLNTPPEGLSLGLSIQNLLGSGIKLKDEKDGLGIVTKIGLGYRMPEGDVNLAADYSFSDDDEKYFCFGAEYWVSQMMAIRGGYKNQESKSGNTTGFRYGFGIKMGLFQFDYAYTPYGDLGDTHRLSVLMEVGEPDRQKAEKEVSPPEPKKTVIAKTPLPEPEKIPAEPLPEVKELLPEVKGYLPEAKELLRVEPVKEEPELEPQKADLPRPVFSTPTQRIEIIECKADKQPLYVATSKNLQMSSHVHKNHDPDFVKVYVQLKNMSQRETFYSNLNFFTLVTETGRKIQYSSKTFGMTAYFQGKDLPPQGETEGSLLFETTERPARLLYQDIQENSLSIVLP